MPGIRAFLRGSPINERDRNLRIAQTLHRDRVPSEQTFPIGDFVALLDGQIVIVAVEKNADDAIAVLCARDPDRNRGLVVKIATSTTDIPSLGSIGYKIDGWVS